MGKIEEVELNIEPQDIKAIADRVAEVNKDSMTEVAATAAAEAIEKGMKEFAEQQEEVAKKAVADKKAALEANDPIAKAINAGQFTEEQFVESKAMRLFKAAKALANGNGEVLRSYNSLSMALRNKSGYANETTDADGAVLVPDPEFDTEVYENLPKYGVAFQFADVRQTDRNAVYALSLDSGLTFYSTAEAGAKTGAKLTFSRKLTELQKYAVIVPSTDELTEDAAIDFWNLVTKELTRAYAKVADEVTFTNATTGIINTTGVLTEPVSGAGTTLSWEDILTAEGKPEDDIDTSGYRWFMRRETWFTLIQKRADAVSANDGKGQFLFNPNPNTPTTPWGTPISFTRVLLKSSEVGANEGFAVYGDLNNYKLYTKRGMALTMLTEATITDADSQSFNLATQDGTAMRAVIRLLGVLPKGNAGKFVVIGTGTVS